MSDSEFCNFIKQIQKDSFKTIKGLSIRKFYALKDHIKECQECSEIVDEILKTPGDNAMLYKSKWDWTRYN